MIQNESHFSLEIVASDGLSDTIAREISMSGLDIHPYKSGYNGKIILRGGEGSIDLEMDSSDTEVLFGSGIMHVAFAQAKVMVEQLSGILKKMNFRIYLS